MHHKVWKLCIATLLALFQSAYFARTKFSNFVSLRSKQWHLLALALVSTLKKCLFCSRRYAQNKYVHHKGPLWASLKKCLFCSCTCTYVHRYKSKICKCITKFENFVSLLCTFGASKTIMCITCITNLKRFVSLRSKLLHLHLLALAHKGPVWKSAYFALVSTGTCTYKSSICIDARNCFAPDAPLKISTGTC